MIDQVVVFDEITRICKARNVDVPVADETELAELDFDSLEITELAIRLESHTGYELKFGGAELRQLETVGDLVAFMVGASGASAEFHQ